MLLEEHQVYEILSNVKKATRNNVVADCPFCGKDSHFFLNLGYGRKGQPNAWDCKKCGEAGNVYSLLRRLDLTHLLKGDVVDVNQKLVLIEKVEEVEENLEPKIIRLPVGFKRKKYIKYLVEERKLLPHHFQKYVIGQTKLLIKYELYSIISVVEDSFCRGFISRVNLTGEELRKINQGGEKKQQIKRYLNSPNADFYKLLLGFEELNFFTQTVILVEGFFDKIRIDDFLQLDYQDEIKCLCTFGKKVSNEQIYKLLTKGIKKVILIQDNDAIEESKKVSVELEKFFEVEVGFLLKGDLDEASDKDVMDCLDNLKKPMDFNLNVVKVLDL